MVDSLGLLQLHPSQFPAQVQRGQGACLVTTPRGCHWAESRSGKAKTSEYDELNGVGWNPETIKNVQ